jgi:hypothetical protein
MISYWVFFKVLTFFNHPVWFIWNKHKNLQKFKPQLYFSATFLCCVAEHSAEHHLIFFACRLLNLLRQYRYQSDERALFVIFLFFSFLIKPTRLTNSQIYFVQISTCFGHLLYPSLGVFYFTFGTGMCHAVLMTASKQDPDIYQCRIYSRKLLMMGREDTRNM